MRRWTYLALSVFFLLSLPLSFATNNRGRLGVGMSNQFIHSIPALSLKLQKSPTFAFGTLLAMDTGDDGGGVGAGLKFYRLLFDEPQLNFYAAFMAAYLRQKQSNVSHSGYQVDFALGSEFHFTGLDSIGFSFEFGLSINKLADEMNLETMGHNFLRAAIHFYI